LEIGGTVIGTVILYAFACIALLMLSILVACAVAIVLGMEEEPDLEGEDDKG
jgi:hypothetical protein